jgi:hypothetical protein
MTVLNLALTFVAMFEALQAKMIELIVNDYPNMPILRYELTIGPCFSVSDTASSLHIA